MPLYPKEERETTLVFDEQEKQWRVYSTSPFHINKILELADVTKCSTDEDGFTYIVEGFMSPSQVRLYNVPSDRQKEHLARMRAQRLND